jgi:acetylglutamate kinase
MPAIIAQVISLESDPFPGWARVRLESTEGRIVEMYDKQPVLGIELQQRGEIVYIDCEVVQERSDSVMVRLLHGVETSEGLSTVEVNRNQIAGLA